MHCTGIECLLLNHNLFTDSQMSRCGFMILTYQWCLCSDVQQDADGESLQSQTRQSETYEHVLRNVEAKPCLIHYGTEDITSNIEDQATG